MATYPVTNGVAAYSNTLVAATADLVEFADRYGYVTVTNSGATIMYARADGQAATVAGAGCYAVLPGAVEILANGLSLWFQSSKAIPAGVNQFGGGNTSDSPASPGEIQSQRSLAGQMANPGTIVSMISTAADTYTVAAAG